MACLLWMSSRCGTKFLGTKTTQFNEMSGVLSFTPSVSSSVKGLVSPIPRHQIPDSGSWERKPFFLSFCGKLSECVECLSLLGGCPGLVHRMVNSGLAMPHSIQIRAYLCVPGHCWAWHMLVSKRGLASLSAYDKLCSLLGGASAWVRDGSVWEEQREHHPRMRDWEWATTTDVLKNRGNWSMLPVEALHAPSRSPFPSFFTSVFYL